MASGVRFDEAGEDVTRIRSAIAREGLIGALQKLPRDAPPGSRFHYSSADTAVLGAVLAGAAKSSVAQYLEPRLWQAIGAEQPATWRADRTGLEVTYGNFSATLRDFARLGVVLANDGARPDLGGRQVIPREVMLDATDWNRVPPLFQPPRADGLLGYGYQVWLLPGTPRRFVLLGVYGQSIFVAPDLRLAVVQTGVSAERYASQSSLAADRFAFWRGIVSHYGGALK